MSDPGTLEHRKRGLEAFARGDFAAAAHWFQWRLAAAPHDVEAQCKLSWAYSQCGRHAEAIATIERAVALRPAQAEVHFYRGMVLGRAGRLQEAAEALRNALRLQPSHPQAEAWLEWIYSELQRSAGKGAQGYRAPAASRNSSWGIFSLPYLSALFVRIALPTAFFGLLFAAFSIINGLQLQKQAREFKAPVVLTYDEFLQQRPRKGWFQIRNCELYVAGTVWYYGTKSQRIFSRYVPVQRPGASSREPVHVLLEATDPAIQASVEVMDSYTRRGDDAGLEAYVLQHPTQFVVRRDIEGVIETGLQELGANTRKIRELSPELASDLTILKEGPLDQGEGEGAVRTGIGLIVLIFLLLAVPIAIWIWGVIRQERI